MAKKDKILALAKGFRGRAKNCYRIATNRVEKALQYQVSHTRSESCLIRHRPVPRPSSKKEAIQVAVDSAHQCSCPGA